MFCCPQDGYMADILFHQRNVSKNQKRAIDVLNFSTSTSFEISEMFSQNLGQCHQTIESERSSDVMAVTHDFQMTYISHYESRMPHLAWAKNQEL